MFKYTLCFIIQDNQVLMLNRNKSPWMGMWNGIGGKIRPSEEKFASIKREIKEETNIDYEQLDIVYKGIVTWNDETTKTTLGLHLFLAYVKGELSLNLPSNTDEGILALKDIMWVTDFNNQGITVNIPYFLPHALKSKNLYEYKCLFKDGKFISLETLKM